MDLFEHAMNESMTTEAPLAARLRPRSLDEFVGQEHIVGEGKLLRRAITADRLFSSIIFTGPPGTGKSSVARAVAEALGRPFARNWGAMFLSVSSSAASTQGSIMTSACSTR